MSTKSDYFFKNIKQLYPTYPTPSHLETEVWEELLEPYKLETILKAIKSYRKTVDSPYAPSPAKFSEYLYEPRPVEDHSNDLPLSPASYLIAEDKKAGRLKHFFPTYNNAVEYLIEEKTKEIMSEEAYKHSTRSERYRLAVDSGLFADFDKTLDMIAERSFPYAKK